MIHNLIRAKSIKGKGYFVYLLPAYLTMGIHVYKQSHYYVVKLFYKNSRIRIF